ncbi:MAG: hypothetical protein ACK56I_07520, partial [bacterium]
MRAPRRAVRRSAEEFWVGVAEVLVASGELLPLLSDGADLRLEGLDVRRRLLRGVLVAGQDDHFAKQGIIVGNEVRIKAVGAAELHHLGGAVAR